MKIRILTGKNRALVQRRNYDWKRWGIRYDERESAGLHVMGIWAHSSKEIQRQGPWSGVRGFAQETDAAL